MPRVEPLVLAAVEEFKDDVLAQLAPVLGFPALQEAVAYTVFIDWLFIWLLTMAGLTSRLGQWRMLPWAQRFIWELLDYSLPLHPWSSKSSKFSRSIGHGPPVLGEHQLVEDVQHSGVGDLIQGNIAPIRIPTVAYKGDGQVSRKMIHLHHEVKETLYTVLVENAVIVQVEP